MRTGEARAGSIKYFCTVSYRLRERNAAVLTVESAHKPPAATAVTTEACGPGLQAEHQQDTLDAKQEPEYAAAWDGQIQLFLCRFGAEILGEYIPAAGEEHAPARLRPNDAVLTEFCLGFGDCVGVDDQLFSEGADDGDGIA